MRQNDRICHRVPLRSPRELQAYAVREDSHIEGTPRLIVGKHLPGGLLEVWTDQLSRETLPRLKELNSGERAFSVARRAVVACARLAARYGCFILNENMAFLGPKGELLVWINPEVLENRVKIYLPVGPEGEQTMARSVTGFLKLWLRFDYLHLASARSLDDLLVKFQAVRAKALERPPPSLPKPPDLRPSFNVEEQSSEAAKTIRPKNLGGQQTKENRLVSKAVLALSSEKPKQKIIEAPKMFLSFPNKDKRPNQVRTPFYPQERPNKHKTSIGGATSGSGEDFEHRTFHNYPSNNSTNHSVSTSVGPKNGGYFPNRTTSNRPKHHPIVQLINSQDTGSQEYSPNKIVLESAIKQEEMRKLKESLQGIGQEVNELFLSNIESEDREEQLKGIAAQFETLLN